MKNRKKVIDIDLNEYDYELPDERIAQYPVGGKG